MEAKINELISSGDSFDTKTWETLNAYIEQSCIPKIIITEYQSLKKDIFDEHRENAKRCLTLLTLLFSKSDKVIKKDVKLLSTEVTPECNFILQVMLLCGEHCSSNEWTDESTVDLSNRITDSICEFYKKDISSLLFEVNGDDRENCSGVGKRLLNVLQSKISKDEWKHYPAAVACYQWIVKNTQRPGMSYCMRMVLPTSLKILEDSNVRNKNIGLHCLRQIITNVPISKLEWYIEPSALYNTLKPLIRHEESALTVPLTECILLLTSNSLSDYPGVYSSINWSQRDDFLSIFLPMLQFETRMDYRMEQMDALLLIMEKVDINIARWAKRILYILDDTSKHSVFQVQAMRVMKSFICVCWPLLEQCWKKLCVVAGRVIHNSEKDEESRKLAKECLYLIRDALPKGTFSDFAIPI